MSHFLYFAWNAGHDQGVTLLELELQAEIDKYVASYLLLKRQFPDRFPAELLRLLFERTRIDPELANGREALYRAASRHAEKFCRHLDRTLRGSRAEFEHEVLAELRRVLPSDGRPQGRAHRAHGLSAPRRDYSLVARRRPSSCALPSRASA